MYYIINGNPSIENIDHSGLVVFSHVSINSRNIITKNPRSLTATPPRSAEYDETQKETPMVELHEDEAVTSIPSSPELHEHETAPSVTEPQEFEETRIVTPLPSLPVALVTAESAISDDAANEVQDSEPSTAGPANLSVHAQGRCLDSC